MADGRYELDIALGELRELAWDSPGDPDRPGLAFAVASLAERAPAPVDVEIELDDGVGSADPGAGPDCAGSATESRRSTDPCS